MNRPLLRVWVGTLGLAALHCGSSSATSPGTGTATGNGDAGATPDSGAVVDAGHGTTDAGSGSGGAAQPCGTAGVSCTKAQAVVSQLTLPTSSSQFAVDLDGDGHPDDALGAFWGELPGGDAQTAEDALVSSGKLIFLFDESSIDPHFVSDPGSAVVDIFGGQPTTAPVFTGAGAFTVDPSQMTATFDGSIAASVFASPAAASVRQAPVVNVAFAFGASTTSIPLHVAQVSVTNTSGAPTTAQINGSIKETDVDGILVPGLAAELTAEVASDPGSQTSVTIEALFDSGGCTDSDGTKATAGDHVISPCEVLGNSLVGALLAPDVQLFDASGNYQPTPNGTTKNALSAGFQVTLVKATF